MNGTDAAIDVIPGEATNGLDVDVTRVQGTVTVDGSAVTQPISAASLPLPTGAATAAKQPALGTAGTASADVITVQGIASMTALLVNGSGVTQPVSGTVTANLAAGTNNIGDVDVLSLPAIPTGTNSIGRVNPEPQTANGLSISRTLSAASTNATSVKGSAGQVYTVIAHNINAAVRYLKLYNKATAPTVGTDTPVMTLPIPANAAGAGFVLDTGGMGIAFATGIGYAITTGVADADTGAVAANEIVVNVLYK